MFENPLSENKGNIFTYKADLRALWLHAQAIHFPLNWTRLFLAKKSIVRLMINE